MILDWQPIKFNLKSLDDEKPRGVYVYPDRSAVYVFSEIIDDVIERACYVGQSEKLQSRMRKHRSDSEENKALKDLMQDALSKQGKRDVHVHYAECNIKYLDCLEHMLYEAYKRHGLYNDPNKIPNCDDEFEINLPFEKLS